MKNDKKTDYQDNTYKNIMLVIITAVITFIITSWGTYLYVYKYVDNSSSGFENLTLSSYLRRLKKIIEKDYLWTDKINDEDLEDAAKKGYVAGLGDEYTEYIPKKEMEDYKEDLKGSFIGIGIYMIYDEKNDRIIVYYPMPESPAEKAGIKSGDQIIRVDGKEYNSNDFDKIADDIKGKEKTTVNIVVLRDGKEISFDIKREKIITNPISTKFLESNIGYLKIPSFDEDTAKGFKEKVQELQNKGAKSLIIDLRNNGGGIVDEATKIADYFLKKGKIIISTVDNKQNKEFTKSKKKPIFNMPIVILTNENTASASEILTVALKDNKRATIVGEKTYGKGVIQTVFSLSDGSGLKITTAEYYTPNGETIHKTGITPDELVELPKEVKSIYAVPEKNDTQLKKAIEILK